MGKSTISTGPFSIAMFVYQRVPFFTYSAEIWCGKRGWGLHCNLGLSRGTKHHIIPFNHKIKLSNAKIESRWSTKMDFRRILHQRFIFIAEYHHYRYVPSGFIRLPTRKKQKGFPQETTIHTNPMRTIIRSISVRQSFALMICCVLLCVFPMFSW